MIVYAWRCVRCRTALLLDKEQHLRYTRLHEERNSYPRCPSHAHSPEGECPGYIKPFAQWAAELIV